MGNQIDFEASEQRIPGLYPQCTLATRPNGSPTTTSFWNTQDEGKVVIKILGSNLDKDALQIIQNAKQIFDLRKHPNVLLLSVEEKSDEHGRIFYVCHRQYVHNNLHSKIKNHIPKLQLIEKLWLIFQMLCGISQLHQMGFVHGDIKPENILISSFNQVFVSDLSSFKPAYIKSDDLKGYNRHFGELDNNQRCYVAPERFVEVIDESKQLEQKADVFSAGCVIAEILMDGNPLFDRAGLLKYKNGTFDPRAVLEITIGDGNLVELIMEMIELNIEKRPQINQCLQNWNKKAFPNSFSRVFFQLGSSFVRPQYLFSDMKISLLKKFMPSIWTVCFDRDQNLSALEIEKMFLEPIDRTIFDKIREDAIEDHNGTLKPSPDDQNCEEFEFISYSKVGKNKEAGELNILYHQQANDKESIIILIHWIGTFIGTCYFPQSRRCALEMLYVIGKSSSLEVRIQYILPYVFQMFEDRQPKVIAKAIEVSIMMFESIIYSDELFVLGTTDLWIFKVYMMPKFENLLKAHPHDQLIQLTYVKYLPVLTAVGRKFTEISLRSRLSSDEEAKVKEFPDGVKIQEKKNNKNVANYDKEIEYLRKKFTDIVNDIAASPNTEIPVQRLFFQNLGSMCEFFGSRVTMDTLIPLLSTVPNRSEFLLKLACLKSITGVGIKSGKQALSRYVLPLITPLLHNSEELVVLETIHTLGNLLEIGLIPKSDLVDDSLSGNKSSHKLLEDLLPYLLHPNTLIRKSTIKFILIMCCNKCKTLFSEAEIFCVIRKKIKPFLKCPSQTLNFLLGAQEPDSLLQQIREPLSRSAYELQVKSDADNRDEQNKQSLSESDAYACQFLKEIMARTRQENQNNQRNRQQFNQTMKKQLTKKYTEYRIVNVQALEDLINTSITDRKLGVNQDQQKSIVKTKTKDYKKNLQWNNTSDYVNDFFEPQQSLSEHQFFNGNHGLNLKSSLESQQLCEVDYIMQALYLLPDFEDGEATLATRLANQSLPYNQSIQIEKLGKDRLVPQPTEIPQFDRGVSRITTIQPDIKNSSFLAKNKLEQQKKLFNEFRPQGRLITTVYGHENPVNSIAVTEDQKLFLTASREDGIVHAWETNEIIQDNTSHSKFSFKSSRQINQICTMQDSQYFVVAGTNNGLDIYDRGRLQEHAENEKQQQQRVNQPGSSQRSVSARYEQNDPQQCILQSLDHPNDGDIMNCLNAVLPISHQDLLIYSSQKGSFFMHDIRSRRNALTQRDTFPLQRGMLTSMTLGQDPYQILCGTIGGYVMVYDVRFNIVSTAYKHSMKYPINSIACFNPTKLPEYCLSNQSGDSSSSRSPMALISTGGPSYELSLLNLGTGNIECLLSCDDGLNQDQLTAIEAPSFFRESAIRDYFSWPEKSETYQSLYRRYLMQTKSLVSNQQIKLATNLDNDLFKASEHRYKLVKTAYESKTACRKILIPRSSSNLLESQFTADYAITGGNDRRIRYVGLTEPLRDSFYINTPQDDECQYFADRIAGGSYCVREKISKVRQLQREDFDINKLATNSSPQAGKVVNTIIEMKKDSYYYWTLSEKLRKVLKNADQSTKMTYQSALSILDACSQQDIALGSANQYQYTCTQDKIVVNNYNGVSEYQKFNGQNTNLSRQKDSGSDRYGSNDARGSKSSKKDDSSGAKKSFQNKGNLQEKDQKDGQQTDDFRESQNVCHQDVILDMALVEINQNSNQMLNSGSSYLLKQAIRPVLLITSSRDGTVKVWQ